MPMELLPPQRELTARFGVGASTMREAVQTLIAVGLLQSHPGKGTWVREDAGAGLIHPEAVRARLGELNARCVETNTGLRATGSLRARDEQHAGNIAVARMSCVSTLSSSGRTPA